MSKPNIEKAYLVSIHSTAFRPGRPAEILEVMVLTYPDRDPRPVYRVQYEDGKEEFIDIGGPYRVVSMNQVRAGMAIVVG